MEEPVLRVEIYSASLKITGDLRISPPLRLSDEVNGLTDYIELKNAVTEPLLSSQLEPRVSLMTHLERYEREFLAVTHLSSVAVASLNGLQPGGQPFTLMRPFALVNPKSIVSFSVREAATEA